MLDHISSSEGMPEYSGQNQNPATLRICFSSQKYKIYLVYPSDEEMYLSRFLRRDALL
jgi:hypothetical protein